MSRSQVAKALISVSFAVLLVSSCSQDDARPTEPQEVVQEMIEVTMVGLDDDVTMRRELVRLYAPDAILVIPSVSAVPVAQGRNVVVDQLIARQVLTGTDYGGAGGFSMDANGKIVTWDRTFTLLNGTHCRTVGNRAEVVDGLITSHTVGVQSCDASGE